MNISQMVARITRLASDNSPLILTSLGVTGTLTTAYLSGKASYQASRILLDEEQARYIKGQDQLMGKEKFEMLWRLYIPALSTAAVTCACIVGANRIGTRRTAAVAAAYTISERAMSEYKHKVIEHIGTGKEQKVRDEIAQERVTRAAEKIQPLVIANPDGTNLCYDSWSGRTFVCDMETIRSAVNSINEQILHSDYATVSEFYDLIGLEDNSISGDMGWNNNKTLEIQYSTVLHNEKIPCLVIDFATVPIRDPHRFPAY